MAELADYKGRLLNHIETVYRPGERHLVAKLFETLGCSTTDRGGPWLIIHIVPGSQDSSNNVIYASEVTPEQWRFEEALQRQLAGESDLAAAHAAYDAKFHREPQWTTHFGIRYPSFAKLEETLDRIQHHLDPELRGRVEVADVFRPGDPGSLSKDIIQAFVKTDVFAAGLLTLGQHIELQAHQLE